MSRARVIIKMYVCFLFSVLILPFTVRSQPNQGHLRLVDNSGNIEGNAGRLEVYYATSWGTVCIDRFDANDAYVACQQLGYSGPVNATSYLATDMGFNQGSSAFVWLDDLLCSGTETRLLNCDDAQGSDCDHSKDVGLTCSRTFRNGRLRLVDNSGNSRVPQSSGRLEVYYNGQWGSVCSNSFGASSARVACFQLGFVGYRNYSNVGSLGYSQGTRTWLDNVRCNGHEPKLIDCPHNQFGVEDCSSSQDIALECMDYETDITVGPGCEGNVRLVNRSGVTQGMAGRVEVCDSGQWITITESFVVGKEEADVICRQLGFSNSVQYGTVGDLGFSQGHTTRSLGSILCAGSESTWTSCSLPPSTIIPLTIDHSRDFAVSCGDTLTSTGVSGAAVAIGIVVPIVVITLFICLFLCCCCCCCLKKSNASPRTVNTVNTSTVTTTMTTTAQADTAYPMQPVSQQPPYPVQTGYSTQPGPPYPTEQYTNPSTYPSAPQQPSAAFGQAPPAPYSSGTQAPSTPYSSGAQAPSAPPHPTTDQESKEKPELYTDAPPAYSEVTSYPPYPSAPPAPGSSANFPPKAGQ